MMSIEKNTKIVYIFPAFVMEAMGKSYCHPQEGTMGKEEHWPQIENQSGINLLKVPSVAGYFTGDLHVHSNYSSKAYPFTVFDIVKRAKLLGLDFLAITEYAHVHGG